MWKSFALHSELVVPWEGLLEVVGIPDTWETLCTAFGDSITFGGCKVLWKWRHLRGVSGREHGPWIPGAGITATEQSAYRITDQLTTFGYPRLEGTGSLPVVLMCTPEQSAYGKSRQRKA